jgi:hypothetical protein
VEACTIETNGRANHTVEMEVEQTHPNEGILYLRETGLKLPRTIKDDP